MPDSQHLATEGGKGQVLCLGSPNWVPLGHSPALWPEAQDLVGLGLSFLRLFLTCFECTGFSLRVLELQATKTDAN